MKRSTNHFWEVFSKNSRNILKFSLFLFMIVYISLGIGFGIKLLAISPLYDHNRTVIPNNNIQIEEIAALAIEKSHQAVSIIEWFVITFITISAGLVVYFLRTFITTNRELDVLKAQIKEASSILEQYTQLNVQLQQILISLPRRILAPGIAQEAVDNHLLSKNALDEMYQWFNWQKWIILKDETGYETLTELNVEELSTNMKIIIVQEISTIHHRIKNRFDQQIMSDEREQLEKLQMLLERRPPPGRTRKTPETGDETKTKQVYETATIN